VDSNTTLIISLLSKEVLRLKEILRWRNVEKELPDNNIPVLVRVIRNNSDEWYTEGMWDRSEWNVPRFEENEYVITNWRYIEKGVL